MRLVILLALLGGQAFAQDIGTIVDKSTEKVQYGYQSETYEFKGKEFQENWVSMRVGDLKAGLDTVSGEQYRIGLYSNIGKLLGVGNTEYGKFLKKFQVEAVTQSKWGDYALFAIEQKIMGNIVGYAGVVLNESSTRGVFGGYYQYDKNSYTMVLVYPEFSDTAKSKGAVAIRNHIVAYGFFMDINGTIKHINDETRFGGKLGLGWKILSAKVEYLPNWEASKWDKLVYGADLAFTY